LHEDGLVAKITVIPANPRGNDGDFWIGPIVNICFMQSPWKNGGGELLRRTNMA